MSKKDVSLAKGITGGAVILASSVLSVILSYVIKENRVFSLKKLQWLNLDDKFGIISAIIIFAGLLSALIYFLNYKKISNIISSGKYNQSVYDFPMGNFILNIISIIVISVLVYVIFASQVMIMAIIQAVCMCIGAVIAYCVFRCK